MGVRVDVRLPDVTITFVPPAPTSTWEGPRRNFFWELFGFKMPSKLGDFPAAPMLTHERPVVVVTVTT